MAKLRDGLEIVAENLELRRQLRELEEKATDLGRRLHLALAGSQLLARQLVKTAEFDAWLLDQDVSSAHMRKPGPVRKAAEIEEASDLKLALQYARRAG